MIENDRQHGKPARLYRDTKANIAGLGLGAADEGCVAYATDTNEFGTFDGAAWVWSNHDLLGTRHSDTTTDAVTRGSIIVGSAIPAWDELVIGGAHQILKVTVGATDPVWTSFDWDDIAAGAAADMVHDHSAAAEGGQLDWDTVWSDAVHDHSANNEGGDTLGLVAITGAGVDVPNGWYLGIGAALERLVFSAAGYISVMGARFGIGVAPATVFDIRVAADENVFVRDVGGVTQIMSGTNGAAAYAPLYLDTTLLAINNYGGGRVGIGTITPAADAILDLTSTTRALLLTRMTTTQRNALAAVNGMVIYNNTNNRLEAYENGSWIDL